MGGRARNITCNGETKPLYVWSRESGLAYHTIHKRLFLGWTPEQAMRKFARPRKVKEKIITHQRIEEGIESWHLLMRIYFTKSHMKKVYRQLRIDLQNIPQYLKVA